MEPLQVLDQLFFTNERVKQLLFLNQFNLKTIYDELVVCDPANAQNLKRQSTFSVRSKSQVEEEEKKVGIIEEEKAAFNMRMEAILSGADVVGNSAAAGPSRAEKSKRRRSSFRKSGTTYTNDAMLDAQSPSTAAIMKRNKFAVRKVLTEDESKLSYSHMRESIASALGPEFKRIFTDELFKKCYAWAKIQTPLIMSNLLKKTAATTNKQIKNKSM